MIFRRLFVGLALLLCMLAPAHAQKTKATLNTEITTNWPDNSVGSITPALLRSTVADILNSIMPTAPVVTGNLACFDGITGLLKDCAVAPTAAGLTVGISTIASGTTTKVLFDNAGVLGEYTVSGTGNVCMTTSCAMTTPNLGTPSAAVLTNATSLPTTALTGALQAAQEPAHTGDMTNSAASLATTVLKTNGVAFTATATAATGQLPGTTTNDSASGGNVGEYSASSIAIGSAVSQSNNAVINITSISLTAGDWDVTGSGSFTGTGTSAITFMDSSISLVSATQDATPERRNSLFTNGATIFNNIASQNLPTGPTRISINGTTTVFLVGRCTFTVSTCSTFGTIRARRVR